MDALRTRSIRNMFAVAMLAMGGAFFAACAEGPTAPVERQANDTGPCYLVDGQVYCEPR